MRTRIVILLLAILPHIGGRAQHVSPVSIGEECDQASAWYRAQAAAWDKVARNQPGNAAAWFNLFQATRFAMIASGQVAEGLALDSILTHLATRAGGSFEYHYATFLYKRLDPAAFGHLQSAFALAPHRSELYDDFMWWYELRGDAKGKADFAARWLRSGGLPPEVNEMCSNVLIGKGKGALIICSGYADTYSLWLFQQQSARRDQHVTNIEMLKDPDYRERVLATAGMRNPYPGIRLTDEHSLLLQLLSLNPGKEIHLSLNHDQALLTSLSDRLYLNGLSFRFSMTAIPNAEEVYTNWSTYTLREFDRVCKTAGPGNAHPLMAGYLMPLMVINRHLSAQGKQREAAGYIEQANALARATGRSSALGKVMERRE